MSSGTITHPCIASDTWLSYGGHGPRYDEAEALAACFFIFIFLFLFFILFYFFFALAACSVGRT